MFSTLPHGLGSWAPHTALLPCLPSGLPLSHLMETSSGDGRAKGERVRGVCNPFLPTLLPSLAEILVGPHLSQSHIYHGHQALVTLSSPLCPVWLRGRNDSSCYFCLGTSSSLIGSLSLAHTYVNNLFFKLSPFNSSAWTPYVLPGPRKI